MSLGFLLSALYRNPVLHNVQKYLDALIIYLGGDPATWLYVGSLHSLGQNGITAAQSVHTFPLQ